MPPAVATLTARLIAVDSVNPAVSGRPDAEAGMVALLETVAGELGLPSRRLPVPGRAPNLLIGDGPRAGRPWLVFESHLDTVGVAGMTIDPFGGAIADGRVRGRGACDTKGSGAAMLLALHDHRAGGGGPADIGLLFTVDEEISRAGIDAFIADQLPALGGRPAAAVVGEPSMLRPIVAHKGVVRMTIRTTGRAAHSSDPSRGRSAIADMVTVIRAIEERHIGRLTATHPLTGPAVGSINVIRGGSGVNVIAERCEIELDRRTVPGEDGAVVAAALAAILGDLRAADPGLDVTIVDTLIHPVFDPAVGAAWASVVTQVLDAIGRHAPHAGVGYGTDASAFAAAGIPAVVLGPGDIAQAHTADEWVAIDQLEGALAIYRALMDRGPG